MPSPPIPAPNPCTTRSRSGRRPRARPSPRTRRRGRARRAMALSVPPPADPRAESLYDAFTEWTAAQGLTLYPHQEEAAIELFCANNVVLATPTGSGKALVAVAPHFAALADRRITFYTAPIKALVSEKFFALCTIFGADNVGMLTGDAAVNSGAPVICCTAEVLANMALREGAEADVGQIVMD